MTIPESHIVSPCPVIVRIFLVRIAIVALSLNALPALCQSPLLPMPREVMWSQDVFILGDTDLHSDPRISRHPISKFEGKVMNEDEAFSIVVDNDSIRITAVTGEGFFRAFSTLEQLIEGHGTDARIPGCTIFDYPAFRIRGFMHDAGRYFIPVPELKKQIEILSGFKINTFHWHLTEDIAWRLASDLFPGLTNDSVTARDTGFYRKDEIREFLDFCSEHYVTVIPEIDMPGHSAAFTRATGLEMQSPEGKALTKALLKEACDLFGTQYFHIGTDEVTISDPFFVGEVADVVRKSGMEVIGWWPGSDAGEDAVRQLWMGNIHPEPGRKTIDSRFLYLNHTDPFADLYAIYNSRICDADAGTDLLLGAICCIWNDRKPSSIEDIIGSNAFYPSMLAFAERAWQGGGCDIRECGVRMDNQGDPAFDAFCDFESRLLACRERFLPQEPFPYLKQTDVHWSIAGPFPNEGDLSHVFPAEEMILDGYFCDGMEYSFKPATGATVYLRHTWGDLVPGFFVNPQPNSTAYAYTRIWSPEDQDMGLWLSFHNFGRSEKDIAPLPGRWDHNGSKAWLNAELIAPPVFRNAGFIPSDMESPYTDENFWQRPPLDVHLRKGWNTFLLKLPVGKFSNENTRLVKWMYTALFVNPDGITRPEGLIYSPGGIVTGQELYGELRK